MASIVVGIGGNFCPEEIDALSEAGANEVYVGFVPASWSDIFGYATSPNRRCWQGASFEVAGLSETA